MLELVLAENSIVADIKFSKPLDYMRAGYSLTHEELAKQLESNSFASAIVVVDRLADELYEDPKHCIKTNALCVSEVRAAIRDRLVNKYYSNSEIAFLAKKYGVHFWETNGPTTPEKERAFKISVEDAFFAAQEALLIPEVLDEMTHYSRYKLDDDGYPLADENEDYIPELDAELVKRQVTAAVEKVMMPRTLTRYERQALMPKPFDFWDWRNSFQQYYFVDVGETINHIHGGSGSSGQREHQGRFAHTFAYSAKYLNKEAPTYLFRYNDRNQMIYLGKFDEFRAYGRELSGNYQSDYSVVKSLFEGRTVSRDEDGEVRNHTNYY